MALLDFTILLEQTYQIREAILNLQEVTHLLGQNPQAQEAKALHLEVILQVQVLAVVALVVAEDQVVPEVAEEGNIMIS
jgi:hypothetical protein